MVRVSSNVRYVRGAVGRNMRIITMLDMNMRLRAEPALSVREQEGQNVRNAMAEVKSIFSQLIIL